MPAIADTEAWKALADLSKDDGPPALQIQFDADPARAERFAIRTDDLYFDYARQRITDGVIAALQMLAAETEAIGALSRMMDGDAVNGSEDRAALHTACRGMPSPSMDVADEIATADARLEAFVSRMHASALRNVVAVGIGGSELGPSLCIDALRDGCTRKMNVRFCANIDGVAFARATDGFDPRETLVVIVSKSFTTLETAANAVHAKAWLQNALGDAWAGQVAVVSANLPATAAFGIPDDHVFPMWDWVGGRYSLWSAVGLPIALAYGWDVFQALRAGAHAMDVHACDAAPDQNIPLLMAMLTVWNTTCLGYQAEACVPYDTRLNLLVPHLQQLQMESNGKGVTTDGAPLETPTQPIVFGGIGTNSQHAFFQQLHQGTVVAPIDILIPAVAPTGDTNQHASLMANALAQADALAFGKKNADQPHCHYPGNRPSSILLYRDLTPRVLGQLIALYEHKTVLAAAMWGINPFDQWGVELGKALSHDLAPAIQSGAGAPLSMGPLIRALTDLGSKS